MRGHAACIHELIAGGAEIDARDSQTEATPLHQAADCNHPDSVKTLVDVYKASVNAADKRGLSALHRAALTGNANVVETLLGFFQCDVNAVSCEGATALHIACARGSVVCIYELAVHGACIETKDNDGDTALHQAAFSNHADCVKILIEICGASINAINNKCQTPLHCAVDKINIEAVQALVSFPHCDIMIRDSDGDTAADVARRRGHQGMMGLIEAKSEG